MIVVQIKQGNVHRNLHGKFGAYVRLGLHLDVPTQCICQLLANCEAQAHALGIEVTMIR